MDNNKNFIYHFGVYGLIVNEDSILLIKKNRGVYTGLLDLPGGTPEFFESFEETLSREILEETGLIINQSRQISTIVNIGDYDGTILRHVGVIYSVEASGDLKTNADGEDSNGCVWVNIKLIEAQNCTPFVQKIVKC